MANDEDWVQDVRLWYFGGHPPHGELATDGSDSGDELAIGYEAAAPRLATGRGGPTRYCRATSSPCTAPRALRSRWVRACQNHVARTRGRTFDSLRKLAINLKVPIVILDELSEDIIRSTGSLDLASGEIFDVRYDVERAGPLGMPAADEQYEFTCGTLYERRQGRRIPHRRRRHARHLLRQSDRAARAEGARRQAVRRTRRQGPGDEQRRPRGQRCPATQEPAPGDPARRLH